MQSEVLVTVLLRETESDLAIKDQVKLAEVLKALDDRLVGNEHAAVELRNEKGEELSSCLHHGALVILEAEDVIEVADHGIEELLDELVAKARLQLQQEVVAIDQLLVVVGERLLNVDLDLVVENLGERLAHPRVVKLDEPDVHLVALGLNDIDISLSLQEVIHGAHDNRKH